MTQAAEQQPQSLVLPISIPERHTSIISSPVAQLFMEQAPHANRTDGELDGQTKLSVHRFLWRETSNGMEEMRQGRQCWALLQSVVEEGLSGGDT